MRWQWNIFQVKEQNKTGEEHLHFEKEFRVMIVKIIRELRKRMDAESGKLQVSNKESEI